MRAKHKGFSLLEMLVAFSIMAVSLTLILRIFGTGVSNAILADEYTSAVQIAESLLALNSVETPSSKQENSGVAVERYHWQRQTQDVTPPLITPSADGSPFPWRLLRMDVEVSWESDGKQERSLALSKLKIVPAAP